LLLPPKKKASFLLCLLTHLLGGIWFTQPRVGAIVCLPCQREVFASLPGFFIEIKKPSKEAKICFKKASCYAFCVYFTKPLGPETNMATTITFLCI